MKQFCWAETFITVLVSVYMLTIPPPCDRFSYTNQKLTCKSPTKMSICLVSRHSNKRYEHFFRVRNMLNAHLLKILKSLLTDAVFKNPSDFGTKSVALNINASDAITLTQKSICFKKLTPFVQLHENRFNVSQMAL